MTDTQITLTQDSLAMLGLVECGGGDDFTYYVLAGVGAGEHAFYVFDDGRWEYRDFSVCTDDESEPKAKGRTLAGLRRLLVSLRD